MTNVAPKKARAPPWTSCGASPVLWPGSSLVSCCSSADPWAALQAPAAQVAQAGIEGLLGVRNSPTIVLLLGGFSSNGYSFSIPVKVLGGRSETPKGILDFVSLRGGNPFELGKAKARGLASSGRISFKLMLFFGSAFVQSVA